MPVTLSRRQVLRFLGGSITGIMFTPVPWKLLDDTAIWTQTGPLVKKLTRGPESILFSHCALCPTGCGLRVRRVNNVPVTVGPVKGDPLSGGMLCATGIVGHHAAYHPLRFSSPLQLLHEEGQTTLRSLNEESVIQHLKEAVAAGNDTLAILDMRPGRTNSLFYRNLLTSRQKSMYLNAPSDDHASLEVFREMLGSPLTPLRFDLAHASTILSFGVPVLENPALAHVIGQERQKVIQIESLRSITAAMAGEWIAPRPGSEAVLALGIANVLLNERLVRRDTILDMTEDFVRPSGRSYSDLLKRFSPTRMSELTGISAEQIEAVARRLTTSGPSVVIYAPDAGGGPISNSEQKAIWGLNVLIGSIGRKGGILKGNRIPLPRGIRESELISPRSLADVPDHSINTLIIENSHPGPSIPWSLIEQKLDANNATVLTFSPILAGSARFSDIALPTSAPSEVFSDTVDPVFGGTSRFALIVPTSSPSSKMSDPARVIGEAFGKNTTTQRLLEERAMAIYSAGRGTIYDPRDGTETELRTIGSGDDFWNALNAGASWTNARTVHLEVSGIHLIGTGPGDFERMTALEEQGEKGTMLVYTGSPKSIEHVQMSPLTSKLCRESGLWKTNAIVRVNPKTAAEAGINDGGRGNIATANGSRDVTVCYDSDVLEGMVEMTVTPEPITMKENSVEIESDVLNLAVVSSDGTWRVSHASLRKAAVS